MRPGLVLVLLVGWLGLGGCASDDGSVAGGGSDDVTVVATTTQLADFARNIGGDR